MKFLHSGNFSWLKFFRLIWYFTKERKVSFIFWNLLLAAAFGYQLVPVYLMGLIVDFFVRLKPGDSLTPFYLLTAFWGVSYLIVAWIRLTGKAKISQLRTDIQFNMRTEAYQNLLNFNLTWHGEENSGNKVQRINTGIKGVENFLDLLKSELYKQITAAFGSVMVLIFIDWKYALILFIDLAVLTYLQWYYSKRIKSLIELQNEAMELFSGRSHESLSNLTTIKVTGSEGKVFTNLVEAEKTRIDYQYKLIETGIRKWKFFQSVSAVLRFVFLFLIGMDILSGRISPGSIITFFAYFEKFDDSTKELLGISDSIVDMKSNAERIVPIFSSSQFAKENGDKVFPKVWRKLNVENLQFSRKSGEEEKLILDGLNLEISKGMKVGIAGRSGGGKSTFVKVLMGVFSPTSGNISIDLTPIQEISSDELFKNIAIVLQDTEVFNARFVDNITLFDEVDLTRLQKALKVACLQDVMGKLSDGLNTMLGEKGQRLSGGERQRIGIARAVYRDSQILILDEATSQLDSNTDFEIQSNLVEYLFDKTIITVAHRLATLKNSDEILVFDGGKIVEQGRFEKLTAQKNGIFASMYAKQMKGEGV